MECRSNQFVAIICTNQDGRLEIYARFRGVIALYKNSEFHGNGLQNRFLSSLYPRGSSTAAFSEQSDFLTWSKVCILFGQGIDLMTSASRKRLASGVRPLDRVVIPAVYHVLRQFCAAALVAAMGCL